tara:strand:+ start:758 stop:1195 length:438 start_codon:yes stop_codon:yes gene_type:complete
MSQPGNFKYTAGLNHVGSYQASARPHVKTNLTVPLSGAITDALEVSFPKVTKFVTIRNDGHDNSASCDIRLAFASGGLHTSDAGYNYITIAESASFSADFRISRLYLLSAETGDVNATVVAGLTNIDSTHLSDSWEGLDGISTKI